LLRLRANRDACQTSILDRFELAEELLLVLTRSIGVICLSRYLQNLTMTGC